MKTFAYTKALQYWAERVKPLILSKPHKLAGNILELRWAIEAFMTFEDSEVLGNDTAPWGHNVCCSHRACPRGSFSVAYSRRQPGPSIGHITQTSMPATPLGETLLQCVAPTNQPSACLPGLEENAREPPQVTMPPAPLMEAEKVAEAEEVAALATSGWTQGHPSRAVVPVGLDPHSLCDEWCHCHSQRRAYLWAEKNQQGGSASDSVPGAIQGSPAATCNSSPLVTLSHSMETLMEGAIVWPWVPLLGFADITNTLQRSQLPWTPPELTEEQAPLQSQGLPCS